MAFFLIPSSFQKRLLRYALSRLELVDTDALDLEKLDIAWGKRSTVELRDVGLRLKNLAKLAHLPASIDLVKAKILLLKVTVPADIYSSAIQIEICGIDIEARISPPGAQPSPAPNQPRPGHDRKRRSSEINNSNKSPPGAHFTLPANASDVSIGDILDHLPTSEDLAKSFLQAAPADERIELEAAILSQSRSTEPYPGEDADDELESGTGVGLSLPGFLASFLKGISDRLEIKIKNVTIDLAFELSAGNPPDSDGLPKTEPVTLQFKIEDIGIQGVTTKETLGNLASLEGSAAGNKRASNLLLPSFEKGGRRCVSLKQIDGNLISHAALFATLSRTSSPPSPSATHSSLFTDRQRTQSEIRTTDEPSQDFLSQASYHHSSSSDDRDPLNQSTKELSHKIQGPSTPQGPLALHESVVTSDGERFADAGEDDEDDDNSESESEDLEEGSVSEVAEESVMSSTYMNDSGLFNQLVDSRFDDGDPEDEDAIPPYASLDGNPSYRAGALIGSSITLPQGLPQSSQQSKLRGKRGSAKASSETFTLPQSSDSRSLSTPAPFAKTLLPPYQKISSQATYVSMEKSQESIQSYESSDQDAKSSAEDLTQSKLFSHEEAESMYMSALSHNSLADRSGWGQSSRDSITASSSEDSLADSSQILYHQGPSFSPSRQASSFRNKENINHGSTNSSPAAEKFPYSGNRSRESPLGRPLQLSKQIISVDEVAIWLPSAVGPKVNPKTAESYDSRPAMSPILSASSVYPDIPGAFSTYAARRNSQRLSSGSGTRPFSRNTKLPDSAIQETERPEAADASNKKSSTFEVVTGRLHSQFDVSVGRILAKLVQQVSKAFEGDKKTAKSQDQPPESSISIKIGVVLIEMLEQLRTTAFPLDTPSSQIFSGNISDTEGDREILLKMVANNMELSSLTTANASSSTQASIEKLSFGYANDNILSFDADLKLRSSTKDLMAPTGKDVSITILESVGTRKVIVATLPIHITLDLQRLDETFSWFGGFSSILNLGSSIASNATLTAASPATSPSSKRSRGVHFEPPVKKIIPETPPSSAANKIDVRIGGFVVDLIGKDCGIGFNTTALKIVSRDEVFGVQVDKIRLRGPFIRHESRDPSINLEILNTRLEYLTSPTDVDLERLLSIIVPSKTKYDQDDDILLDTLLRQRRQGGVLRVTVGLLKGRVSTLEDMHHFPILGEEISKLATVAKYLPEDERPGILTLALLRGTDIEVDINGKIGKLQLESQNINVAHVGLPSLVALAVEQINVLRNNDETLISEVIPFQSLSADLQTPMIMARIIGDEMEPTIKIKLYNLLAEYRVPTTLALMGLSENMAAEEMVAEMVGSVATITDSTLRNQYPPEPPVRSNASDRSNSLRNKPLNIEITLNDCAIGLNPTNLPGKALAIFTETRISGALPKNHKVQVTVDVHKASLLIIDDTENIVPPDQIISSQTPSSPTAFGQNQVRDLGLMGFVAITSISSAKVVFNLSGSSTPGEECIELEIRDDLLVIESCADSTQTLISIFNGLALPTPPSKVVKYRSEIVPINDMLASLSGEAFSPPQPGDLGDYPLIIGEEDMFDDDVPQDLQFISTFYDSGPSGISENNYDSPRGRDGQPPSRVSTRDIDDQVLLESIQGKLPPQETGVLEFHDNYFGADPSIKGTAHRWDSVKNKYGSANEEKIRTSPLIVKVRDVHIIWNLFDGYDWQKTRDVISKAVEGVEARAIERKARLDRRLSADTDEEDDPVIRDFLFNSIYIGVDINRDPQDLAKQINRDVEDLVSETGSYATTAMTPSPSRQGYGYCGRKKKLRLNRSKRHKITFELKGVSLDLIVFPSGSGETQSSLDVRVYDLEIFDHVPTSTWKKFATYQRDAGERESGISMIHLEILNVKPIADLDASEIVLKVSILPLRLHVDQDALDFITRFFEFKDDSVPSTTSSSDVPFLQRIEINAVKVKLDYKPKTVDYAGLRSGHTTEFMNFFILDQADLILRHVIIYGVSGMPRLSKALNDIWMPDIQNTQLPGIIAGLAPLRPLVGVSHGLRDLVFVPVAEYKKDGRLVRSIQKGALAFAKTTTTELAKMGAKLAIKTQSVLQGAEGLLVQNQSQEALDEDSDVEDGKKPLSLYADPPVGVLQGLRGAYASLERDLLLTRDAIIAMPGEVMESGSAEGAARAVLRRAPTVIFRPAIGASKAVAQTLMGATSALDPEERRRVEDVSGLFISHVGNPS
ncbi:MAG: autophagy- protein 2 [Trizodia sp. TS-e1964]|nr:MAG: autophagy- protein 2 [Trizodia sp. TS-e1964]